MWNDIGTGKTFSATWAVDYLFKIGAIRHVLLVGPISTLEVVWQRTLFRVNQDINIEVLRKGLPAAKKKAVINRICEKDFMPNVCTITIVNPDSLHIIADEPGCDFLDLVIVDEAATFRNHKSRRYDALCRIIGNYYENRPGTVHAFHQEKGVCNDGCKPIVRRVKDKDRSERNWKRGFWPMTGSPRPETATDVWSISALAAPDRVPRHFGEFRDMVMTKVDQFTWIEKPDAEKIIADMLRGNVTRFTREECFDLPPTQSFTHELEMTAEQKRLVKELRAESMAEVEAGLIKGPNQAVVINKFLQIFSGAVKVIDNDGNEQIHKVDCQPKLQALDELIEGSRGPIIIAAEFIGAIARLAEHAERNKIPYRTVVGDTKADDRRHIFDDLQADRYKLLIAHPKTIAHGLTLTTSNVILWWTPIYSHEMYEQFNGRITRPGQERRTYIVHFTCSALERMVLRKLTKKMERQNILLKYLEGNND